MNKIKFYAGDWDSLPAEDQAQCFVPTMTTETGKVMSNRGRALVKTAAIRPISFFTNNDDFFNGFRLGVAHSGLSQEEIDEKIEVYFASEGALTKLRIRDCGRMDKWPNGFFDQIELDLCGLVDVARAKREKRKVVA